MKKNFNCWLIITAVLIGQQTVAIAGVVTDATNTRIELVDRPSRIITLAPSLSELVMDLALESGGLNRLVGVSEFSNFPAELKRVKSVGPYHRLNLERILSLKPDLVLATRDGNSREQILRLRELKVPVVVIATGNLIEIQDSIRIVSDALGEKSRGEALLKQLRDGLAEIRIHAKNRRTSKPRVLLQVGDDPLVVAGKSTFLNEALETVGAENIYSDSSQSYPKPSLEDAVRKNPEVILVLSMTQTLAPYELIAEKWKRFPAIAAVKRNRVKALRGDRILRPTRRLLDGLKEMEAAIHEK